jgi:hypothetical protein
MDPTKELDIEGAAKAHNLAPSIVLGSLMLLLEDGVVVKDQTELHRHLVSVLF